MSISAAVLGRPIAHSLSPDLHRAAFAALGLTDAEYSRFELGAEELEDFLDAHPAHTGFSLTMPLKERLVELAGQRGWVLDPTAEATGVANTLVRGPESTTVANTDVDGIVRALAPVLGGAGMEPDEVGPAEAEPADVGRGSAEPAEVERGHNVRATILGAGATARSAILACHRLGATAVDLLVRTPSRAAAAVDLASRLGLEVSVAGLAAIRDSAIVISTLPAEAAPALIWPDAQVPEAQAPDANGPEAQDPLAQGTTPAALDVAYAADSSFLQAAADHGFAPVPGTAMLVEQAVAQSALFLTAATGTPPTPDQWDSIAQAMHAAVADRG